MTHLVVGAGEVGTAVHTVLSRAHDTRLRDLTPVDMRADVLHICFPHGPDFTAQVKEYQAEHGAGLVVVHSTVPPGTCDPHGWVHSPVRGRHPHLAEGLIAFVKHFGGERAAEAATAFEMAGVRTRVHDRAFDTEAGKVWELIQYGIQIRVEKAIHAWCVEHGVDFDVAYSQMARTYNDGFQILGQGHFSRPVLEHVPGPIGGHCVTQNAPMVDHPLAVLVTGEAS